MHDIRRVCQMTGWHTHKYTANKAARDPTKTRYRTVKLNFNLFTMLLLMLDALVRFGKNGKEIKLSPYAKQEMIWFGVFVLLLPRTYPIFKYEYARVPSIHNLAQLCYLFNVRSFVLCRSMAFALLLRTRRLSLSQCTTNHIQYSIWKFDVLDTVLWMWAVHSHSECSARHTNSFIGMCSVQPTDTF